MTNGTSADVEKQSQLRDSHGGGLDDESSSSIPAAPQSLLTDVGEDKVGAIRQNNVVLRFLANLERRIDGNASFEAMGVERVPEDKRRPPQILNVSTQSPTNHAAVRRLYKS